MNIFRMMTIVGVLFWIYALVRFLVFLQSNPMNGEMITAMFFGLTAFVITGYAMAAVWSGNSPENN